MHLVVNLPSLFVLLAAFADCHGFFGWFWGNSGQPATVVVDNDPAGFNGDGTSVAVPFEMTTSDEDFLREGKKYGLLLSKLDACHHKVFLNLKASCSVMSEEEMGKLSVRLLNCQSAVEGRATFPCTDDMSLRACTRDMDQHTWNAYHLVSNRARAVCYSTRQQQFHAKTEMTINKLVWFSDQQVRVMFEFEKSQQRVSLNQEELMTQQEKLKSSQQDVQDFVTENLKELTVEKSLIVAGQRELARMTDSIRKKLDVASSMMLNNEQQRRISHRQLVEDLAVVQEYAKLLQEKLDTGTRDLHDHHKETAVQFENTLSNLAKINASIEYVQKTVEETRTELGNKLGWVANYLHSSDEHLTMLSCCVLHACYLLAAMLLAGFLHMPMVSRCFLLFLVPMNALSEVQERSSLRFGTLTVLLAIFVLGDYAQYAFRSRRRRCYVPALEANGNRDVLGTSRFSSRSTLPVENNDPTPLAGAEGNSLAPDPLPDVIGPAIFLWPSPSDAEPSDAPPRALTPIPPSSPGCRVSMGASDTVRRDLLRFLDLPSPNSRQSSPSRSSMNSSSSRRLCSGLNRHGIPCKSSCAKGKDFCRHHE